MARALLAKMSNRRPRPAGPTPAGRTHIVDVTCPACGTTFTVMYGGWTALGCLGDDCDVDLYRTRRHLPEPEPDPRDKPPWHPYRNPWCDC